MSNHPTSLPQILIVEDNAAVADMYHFRLDSEGFKTDVAYDGQQGLELAKRLKPALILLDLKMPVMDGEEMLKILRSQDWGANMRVIVLTNISREEAPRSLGLLSVDRYVVKAHSTPAQVTEIVYEVLGLKRD